MKADATKAIATQLDLLLVEVRALRTETRRLADAQIALAREIHGRRKDSPAPAVDLAGAGRFLSAREVCLFYGVCGRTVARWAKNGTIPPPDKIIGNKYFWNQQTLLERGPERLE
jgi:predicted DNA-binding transcriptional regulator AlpA